MTKEQEDAFERVKATLSENTTLAYFDPPKHTGIHVDDSPLRIAGISSKIGRPIADASRSLTSVEQCYSQTEREAASVSVVRHSQWSLTTVPRLLSGTNRHQLPGSLVGLYAYSHM